MSDWHPIDTIRPDDGHVLFYGLTRHDNKTAFSGYISVFGNYYSDYGDECYPTHWMPLPEPPDGER